MLRSRRRLGWWGLWLLLCVAAPLPGALAAPPWQRLVVFRHVEADPEVRYELTDDHGPWLILAKTFMGDHAEDAAQALVLELRTRYKMKAYVHRLEFDYSGDVTGMGVDPLGNPKKMRYRRDSAGQELGVLIGDFSTVDDPQAQRALAKVKYLKPACLETREQKEQTNSPLAGLRVMQQAVLADGNPKKLRGPLGHAFMVTNPLLPREYFVPQGPDRLTLEMNQDVEYSLLKCPGKFTVKVATFTGRVIVDQQKIRELEREGDDGSDDGSRLAEAAEQAHKLTLALRAQGVEAYEFHDRYSSLVTVGSFNSVGAPREDGKIEIDPRMHAIMLRYSAGPLNVGGTPGAVRAKSMEGIAFDAQPMPVEVPRQLLSSAYEMNSAFGRR